VKGLRNIRVLIPTLIGVAVVLFGLVMMVRSGGTKGDKFRAVFDDVTGLVNHSPVLHRGVRVGEVVQIEGEGSGWRQAMLTVKMDPDSGVQVDSDATMTLRLKSLLGEMFLDLDPGHSGEPLTSPITTTHRDTSFDRLIYSGAEAFKNLSGAEETKQIVDELKQTLQVSSGDVVRITSNARVLLDTLVAKDQTIATIISNLDNITTSVDNDAGKLGDTIVSINGIVSNVRTQLAKNHDRIVEMTDLLKRVVTNTDLAKLDEQLTKLPEMFDKAYEGMRVIDALMHHCTPAMGYLTILPWDAAQNGYALAEQWSKNPVLRTFWTKILSTYLNNPPPPGCAP